MAEVWQRQCIQTPRVLRQQSLDTFLAGPRANATSKARLDGTTPTHPGIEPPTTQSVEQNELLELVHELDNA